MDPSEGPPEKKQKRLTPLETKLERLRHTLGGLQPIWKRYDSGLFMEMMRHTQDQIDRLTPETVEDFIANGPADWLLHSLDLLGHELLRETPFTPMSPERINLHQSMRHFMALYVGRVRESLQAFVTQAKGKPDPSEFAADSKIWDKYQQRPDAILCLRPADRRGWPIPLMHKAFCDFTRHFHAPRLDEHTPKYLLMAGALCNEMPSAFDSETARRNAFEAIFHPFSEGLTRHHEYPISPNDTTSMVEESGAGANVARSIPWEGGALVLMLAEFKNEVGDSYMQICRSYEVLCGDPKVKLLVEFGNPMFLLCILGPYLMVCGAVKRESVHVQPLTTLIPMFPDYGIEGHQVQLAYCLQALKEGLDALKTFWQDMGVTSNANEKLIKKIQKQHPNCPDNGLLCFDGWEGTFKSPMYDQKNPDKAPCFLATLHKAGNDVQVLVKFVYKYIGTYGKAVHEYLHGLRLAPRLYSAVDLHHGLVMVVMEHLAFEEGVGGWVELDTFERRLDDMAAPVRKKLETVIDSLQRQKMVHADFRPKNIMVKVDEQHRIAISASEPVLSLVDFDWAGTVGEACYPPFLKPRIPWPTGAKGYGKIGQGDDRILLNNWWDAFVQTAETS